MTLYVDNARVVTRENLYTSLVIGNLVRVNKDKNEVLRLKGSDDLTKITIQLCERITGKVKFQDTWHYFGAELDKRPDMLEMIATEATEELSKVA